MWYPQVARVFFNQIKASHTSGSTKDSETWSLVGANDSGLKKEVIPVLHQLEVSLNLPVKLICKEDNTACVIAIKKGYSTTLRYLKRHAELSLGFPQEVFFPDRTQGSPPATGPSLHIGMRNLIKATG